MELSLNEVSLCGPLTIYIFFNCNFHLGFDIPTAVTMKALKTWFVILSPKFQRNLLQIRDPNLAIIAFPPKHGNFHYSI